MSISSLNSAVPQKSPFSQFVHFERVADEAKSTAGVDVDKDGNDVKSAVGGDAKKYRDGAKSAADDTKKDGDAAKSAAGGDAKKYGDGAISAADDAKKDGDAAKSAAGGNAKKYGDGAKSAAGGNADERVDDAEPEAGDDENKGESEAENADEAEADAESEAGDDPDEEIDEADKEGDDAFIGDDIFILPLLWVLLAIDLGGAFDLYNGLRCHIWVKGESGNPAPFRIMRKAVITTMAVIRPTRRTPT